MLFHNPIETSPKMKDLAAPLILYHISCIFEHSARIYGKNVQLFFHINTIHNVEISYLCRTRIELPHTNRTQTRTEFEQNSVRVINYGSQIRFRFGFDINSNSIEK